MALSHTILAFLLESPHSGYDLGKSFQTSVSSFWKASHQQVYRELARMNKEGLIEYEMIEQKGRPNKKIYSITEKGRAEFQDWYISVSLPSSIREDLLVKVLSASHMPKVVLEKQIIDRLHLHQDQLQYYKEKEHEIKAANFGDLKNKFIYLTLRRGILNELEWINWCYEVLSEISEITNTVDQ